MQEVNHIFCPNKCWWRPSFISFLDRLGARKKIAEERSQQRPHLTPINNKCRLSKDKVVKEVAGGEVEGMEAVVEVGDVITEHQNCSTIGANILSLGGNAVVRISKLQYLQHGIR